MILFAFISLIIPIIWCEESDILDDYCKQSTNVILYLDVIANQKNLLKPDQSGEQLINESMACSYILNSLTMYKTVRQTSECYLIELKGSQQLAMKLNLVFPNIALFQDEIEDADYGQLISANLKRKGITVKNLTVIQHGFLGSSAIWMTGMIRSKDYIQSGDLDKVVNETHHWENKDDEDEYLFFYFYEDANYGAKIRIKPELKDQFSRAACNQTLTRLIAGAEQMEDIVDGCWTYIVPGIETDIPVQYIFLSVDDMIYEGLYSVGESLALTIYDLRTNGSDAYPNEVFGIQSTQVLINTVDLMYLREPDLDFPGSPFEDED